MAYRQLQRKPAPLHTSLFTNSPLPTSTFSSDDNQSISSNSTGNDVDTIMSAGTRKRDNPFLKHDTTAKKAKPTVQVSSTSPSCSELQIVPGPSRTDLMNLILICACATTQSSSSDSTVQSNVCKEIENTYHLFSAELGYPNDTNSVSYVPWQDILLHHCHLQERQKLLVRLVVGLEVRCKR